MDMVQIYVRMKKKNPGVAAYKSLLRTLPGYRKSLLYRHLFKDWFKGSDNLIKRAELAAYGGDFKKAKNYLLEALTQNSDNQMLWQKYAKACYRNNDMDEVEHALEQYASLNTDSQNPKKKEDRKNTTTVVLDLWMDPAVGYLAECLLESETANNVIILGSEQHIQHPILKNDECAIFNPNNLYKPQMLQGDLKSVNTIERNTQLRNIWHLVSSDMTLFTTSGKGRYFDKKTPYSHEQLELIVRILYTNIETFITHVSPDLIVNFSPFYIYELVFLEIAKNHQIKFAFLSSTQIKDYVAFTPSPFEQFIYAHENRNNGVNKQATKKAEEFVNDHFEGTRKPSDAAQLTEDTHKTGREIISWRNIVESYVSLFSHYWKNRVLRRDLSYPLSMITESSRTNLHRAMEQTRSKVRSNPEVSYISDDITSERAVLFALHSEPETALSLFSPHLPSQDATADIIARSLPFDCKLYVKDHPRMTGLRTKNYYETISDRNPNINFLSSDCDALIFLEDTDVVITAASTVGLEALIFGTPVITLGACHYQGLYGTIPIRDLTELPNKIQNSLSTRWDTDKMRKEVTRYIAGCMYEGYPFGVYGKLRGNYDYTSKEFQGFCEWFCNKVNQIKSDPEWEKPSDYGFDI